MTQVAEYKKKIVNDIIKATKDYSIIGLVNMEGLPAPQLQTMKKELRGKINLFMTKKRLIKIALEKIKNEKKGVEELEKYFEGMPALLFTNESPFKLSRLLQKSKSKAPAKAGQTAPDDITISKGPTPFAPGPIISELSTAGLKVGVENGKVAVKEDTVIVKKGEKIKPKIAEILTRLDIKPMEVGLGLIAAYEDEIIYQKDVLAIDDAAFNQKVNLAAVQAFNLAFNVTYTTKDNINLLISKAFNDAKALGVGQEILDKGIIENLLSKAENSMLSIKNMANIETVEKPQAPKEEVKPAPKETGVLKEERVLEQEKKIIEEEKKLEEEKPKAAPVEKEVQEAVKEEEEKKLESERIEKEKELEKVKDPTEIEPIKYVPKEVEQPKEEPKQPQPQEKPKPATDTDTKVKQMVEKTKKFITGTEETAADIIEDVKKEEAQIKKEEKQEIPEKTEEPKQTKTEVPSAHDLKEQKEDKEKTENKEQKEVEELTKELIKKGTLRKNKL